jgi:hypothetical protein
MSLVSMDRLAEWNDVWSLAVVFGLASIPWTYAFVGPLDVPLWPAFIGSATVFAAGGGRDGLVRGAASNLAGLCYAAITIGVVEGILGGGLVALSVVVGAFMFLASLHDAVPALSFTPGGFFGYATLSSVHAAGATVFGVAGLPGETLGAAVSMAAGAAIGFAADLASAELS